MFDFRLGMGGEPREEPRDRGCSSVLDLDCDGGLVHSGCTSTDGTMEPAYPLE